MVIVEYLFGRINTAKFRICYQEVTKSIYFQTSNRQLDNNDRYRWIMYEVICNETRTETVFDQDVNISLRRKRKICESGIWDEMLNCIHRIGIELCFLDVPCIWKFECKWVRNKKQGFFVMCGFFRKNS